MNGLHLALNAAITATITGVIFLKTVLIRKELPNGVAYLDVRLPGNSRDEALQNIVRLTREQIGPRNIQEVYRGLERITSTLSPGPEYNYAVLALTLAGLLAGTYAVSRAIGRSDPGAGTGSDSRVPSDAVGNRQERKPSDPVGNRQEREPLIYTALPSFNANPSNRENTQGGEASIPIEAVVQNRNIGYP